MLSRHADASYWTGRYIERAESTARMIDVHYHFGLESPLVGEALRWTSLLAISGKRISSKNITIKRTSVPSSAFSPSTNAILLQSIRASWRPEKTDVVFATRSLARCGPA